jgi:hypothetical protein
MSITATAVLETEISATSTTNAENPVTSTPDTLECPGKYTVGFRNTCQDIANAFDMTLSEFFKLNPDLNEQSCLELESGRIVCVTPYDIFEKRK